LQFATRVLCRNLANSETTTLAGTGSIGTGNDQRTQAVEQSLLRQAFALHRSGRLAEAAQAYDNFLRGNPGHFEALLQSGLVELRLQRFDSAENRFAAASRIAPDSSAAANGRVAAMQAMGRRKDALALLDQLLERRSDDAIAWNNHGNLLLELGQPVAAIASYQRAIEIQPTYPEAWHNRGAAQLALKDFAAAETDFTESLRLRPNYPEALEHRALAVALSRIERGFGLLRQERYPDALNEFDCALETAGENAAAWQGRGIALARLNHEDAAVTSFSKSLRLRPGDWPTLYNRAAVYSGLKRYGEAIGDLENLLAANPDYPLARGRLINNRLQLCDWHDLDVQLGMVGESIGRGIRTIHPMAHLVISHSPAEQLACARMQAAEVHPPPPAPLYRGDKYRHERIRLAYLSGDYYEHAIPYLITGVLEEHDRDRFETFGISYGSNDSSEMRRRLEQAFSRFFQVREKPDREIAMLLRDLEIDVAVDLKGYTGGARPGILAHRPAPVQVNYLGYPGTMGAPYIDYLIADRIVIPSDERQFYSEQIVYLPNSYQANDSSRRIAPKLPSRHDAGLPGDAFVFCCFNGGQKILPQCFAGWMRILRRVENSVLWLLENNEIANANLRAHAASQDVEPERLIFARHERLDLHLARLKLADLVLDTSPYGAHTTASDALWAGVPVLTRIGETFAGRVAASLLSAVGLPELMTRSAGEYEELACALAGSPHRLARLREQLARNRSTMPLFNTRRMTRDLEAAYSEMWQRHQRGERPAAFAVA
jgi:protein O-GlcNAc transferase